MANSNTYIRDGFVSAGSAQITGSLGVTGGITGTLTGTASYATQALSASYAPSAVGATFPFTGSAIITGSLKVIGNTQITGSLYNSSFAFISSGLVVGSELGGYVQSGNHKSQIIATSTQTPLMIQGGSGAVEIWKDTTPSRAVSFGMAVPGSSITNDFVFSAYQSSWAERMRITSAGNVGIGTASPGSLLQVGGLGATATATPTAIQMDNSYRNAVGGNTSLKFYFYKNGTETYGFGVNNTAGIEYHAGVSGGGSAYHAFYTDTTEKIRITAAGNVGIGTTTPSAKLDVNGNAVITGTLLMSGNSLVAGYNPTPLAGTIKDGVTSVLGDLNDWDSDYYQGDVLYSETAGGTITFGQLCYRTQNETWALADATTNASAAIHMLGICVKSSTATNPTSILINGFVETSTYATIVKSGEPLYMATTAGSMTKTAPTTAGNIVRLIGHTFWDSNSQGMIVIRFNPESSWIEL